MIRAAFIVLTLMCSVVSAQSVQELIDRFDRAYAADRMSLAINTAERILELYPDSAWWHFQAGCVLARLDRHDESIEHLNRCSSLGFSGITSFEEHSDLDPLRDDARFVEVMDQVRTHAVARMNAFQEEAKRHTPLIYVPDELSEGTRPPLILALHGTGMDGESMHDSLLEFAKQEQMILISPDALRPSGDGFSWTYRDESEWFVEYLIELSITEHNVDPEQVYLVGFSQGANIALVMGQIRPELFAGVIPVCGHYEPQIVDSDIKPAPFYLMTGARDDWRRTYSIASRDFAERGGHVQLRVIPKHGHELPSGRIAIREFAKAFKWFNRLSSVDTTVP